MSKKHHYTAPRLLVADIVIMSQHTAIHQLLVTVLLYLRYGKIQRNVQEQCCQSFLNVPW